MKKVELFKQFDLVSSLGEAPRCRESTYSSADYGCFHETSGTLRCLLGFGFLSFGRSLRLRFGGLRSGLSWQGSFSASGAATAVFASPNCAAHFARRHPFIFCSFRCRRWRISLFLTRIGVKADTSLAVGNGNQIEGGWMVVRWLRYYGPEHRAAGPNTPIQSRRLEHRHLLNPPHRSGPNPRTTARLRLLFAPRRQP